jgi:hypothetical protein
MQPRMLARVIGCICRRSPIGTGFGSLKRTRVKAELGGHMKRLVVGIIAAAFLVSMAHTAMAQTKTVSSEMRTETAIVEAIDPSTRTVTLEKPDGTFVAVVAGPDIQRFAEVKVGDKVEIVWTEAVLVSLERGQ